MKDRKHQHTNRVSHMRNILPFAVLSLAFIASSAHADRVVEEVSDNTAGGAIGVLSGVMAGGAVGGPIGALVGGGAGFWLGRAAQAESGLSEPAYVVESASGDREVVRSPNARFVAGDLVMRNGIRIVPEH
ncbi:hypothetical protein [Stutzerimonas urumqiensis]|uniref:hypothetical protein n=1 Tax=Stutzerimonas urumqiensis TaxID=638269 RepID=UPI003DA5AB66